MCFIDSLNMSFIMRFSKSGLWILLLVFLVRIGNSQTGLINDEFVNSGTSPWLRTTLD